MQVTGWDTETATFRPARMAPPLVVSSVAHHEDQRATLIHVMDGVAPLWDLFERAVGGEYIIAGHNLAYDVACLLAEFNSLELVQLVFAAYDADRMSDTMVRQKLLDISEGCYRGWTNAATGGWIKHGYRLVDLTERHLGRTLDKDNPWRTRYIELVRTPVDQWPPEAREYAEEDGVGTRDVWKAQAQLAARNPNVLVDEFRQARAALALHLISVWGIRTDKEGVELLRRGAEEEIAEISPILIEEGLLRKNGSRAMKKAKERMKAINPTGKKTPTGAPSMDEEACKDSGDPVLIKFSQYTKAQNILAKDVKAMALGIEYPIHTSFDSLMETGRTSSSKPNLQNPRRKAGVRECFVPREGCYFAACDFDKAELHTLAQVCLKVLGYSRLAERLNAGFDPHLDLGAQILGIGYEEAVQRKGDKDVKQSRQHAKPANFGFPGGMGVKGFLVYARDAYGIDFEFDFAKRLREHWLENWPEMNDYFAWVKAMCGDAGVTTIQHLFSQRLRGHVPYTVACNSFFQGLCADGAKAAMWAVCRAQYTDPSSPLWGCRTVNFVHDELIVEVPIDRAHDAAMELQRLMVEHFNPWVPDVPVRAGVSLMRRWSKSAEPAYRNGELIPWEDAA